MKIISFINEPGKNFLADYLNNLWDSRHQPCCQGLQLAGSAVCSAQPVMIRMLPVYVSVAGLGIKNEPGLFMGWFGPRGLASMVFCVIVMNADLPHEAS